MPLRIPTRPGTPLRQTEAPGPLPGDRLIAGPAAAPGDAAARFFDYSDTYPITYRVDVTDVPVRLLAWDPARFLTIILNYRNSTGSGGAASDVFLGNTTVQTGTVPPSPGGTNVNDPNAGFPLVPGQNMTLDKDVAPTGWWAVMDPTDFAANGSEDVRIAVIPRTTRP